MASKGNRLRTIRQPSLRERSYLNEYFALNSEPADFELRDISLFIGMDMDRVRNRRHNAKGGKVNVGTNIVSSCDISSLPELPSVPKHSQLPPAVSQSLYSTNQSHVCPIGAAVDSSPKREGAMNNRPFCCMTVVQPDKQVVVIEGGGVSVVPLSFGNDNGKVAIIQPPPFVLEPQPIWRSSCFDVVPLEWQLIDRSHYRGTERPQFRIKKFVERLETLLLKSAPTARGFVFILLVLNCNIYCLHPILKAVVKQVFKTSLLFNNGRQRLKNIERRVQVNKVKRLAGFGTTWIIFREFQMEGKKVRDDVGAAKVHESFVHSNKEKIMIVVKAEDIITSALRYQVVAGTSVPEPINGVKREGRITGGELVAKSADVGVLSPVSRNISLSRVADSVREVIDSVRDVVDSVREFSDSLVDSKDSVNESLLNAMASESAEGLEVDVRCSVELKLVLGVGQKKFLGQTIYQEFSLQYSQRKMVSTYSGGPNTMALLSWIGGSFGCKDVAEDMKSKIIRLPAETFQGQWSILTYPTLANNQSGANAFFYI
ncbi:hypothetical protein BDP27DRAFT_1365765 [Rhodocollybia butyracea]|uniref:Uncharacterized protein n=1 Tax=Rhodocollybia butyracea TaxID=206335 RepID=A0A9P5U403_9AGAR|nr:hypothetical protein BDP27DRAFT_1365765 [Rhodocollybia butyracea]